MSDHPIPSYACQLWLAGDTLRVRFPNGNRSHVIDLTADEFGLKNLLVILRARRTGELMLGTKGAPIQYSVDTKALADAFLRSNPKRAPKPAKLLTDDLWDLIKEDVT